LARIFEFSKGQKHNCEEIYLETSDWLVNKIPRHLFSRRLEKMDRDITELSEEITAR
jgi:hypothetical protein